jgi:hypothetical protein
MDRAVHFVIICFLLALLFGSLLLMVRLNGG